VRNIDFSKPGQLDNLRTKVDSGNCNIYNYIVKDTRRRKINEAKKCDYFCFGDSYSVI
jgi:hypothetical protein